MNSKFNDWVKKHKKLVTALLMSLLPLAAGSLLCAFYGKSIFDIYLPVSEWNDEIFYYKQVETILQHGIPQGYYGFDESHAQVLSFAAWSPVILIPYVIWGFLFGWNFLSPILCNLVLMTVAVFVFAVLTKPDKKQAGILCILYLASMFTTRYMLSAMGETVLIFMGILYLGLCIRYTEEEKKYQLVLMYLLIFFMTLIRPYYLIFILYPAYLFIRKQKIVGSLVTLAVMGVSLILYFTISGKLCAPYFTSIVRTYWLEHYKVAGLWEGIKYSIKEILNSAREYWGLCVLGIKGDSERSALALQFLVVLLVLGVQTVIDWVQKKKTVLFHALLTGGFFIILMAIFLMYQLMAGTRHMVVLITMAVFVISRMESRRFVKVIMTGALLLFIYIQIPHRLLYCELPFKTAEAEAEFIEMESSLHQNMRMNEEEVPSFDNVIIWTLSDDVAGQDVMLQWQLLYAVPAGYGINCCSGGYVQTNFDTLKSRYLAVPVGGTLEMRCLESQKTEVGRTENVVVFDMR